MAFWVSSIIDRNAGKLNQGWFDVPVGWVSDSFGVISFHHNSSGGDGGDSELYVNGLCVSGHHQGWDWGYTHSCVVPRGVTLTASTNRGVGHFKFKRMGS